MKKNVISVALIIKNKKNDKNNVKYVKFMLKMNTKKDEKEKEKEELCSYCERDIHSEKNCWIKHSEKMLKFVKKTWQNKIKMYSKSMMTTLNLNLNLNLNIKLKKKAFTEDFFYIALTVQKEICLINTMINMWIADTAVSCHICCDKSAFQILELLRYKHSVQEVNRKVSNIEKETVSICLELENREYKDITLNNVLWVSDMKYNLLSLEMILKWKCHIKFDKNNPSIMQILQKDTWKTIEIAHKKENLYYLDTLSWSVFNININNNSDQALVSTTSKLSRKLWHRCLSHINNTRLEELLKIVQKIDLEELSAISQLYICKSCFMTLSQQQIFCLLQQQTIKISEYLHIDVVDFIHSIRYNEDCWYIVCTDNYFCYCFVFTIKIKEKADYKVVKFIHWVKNQTEFRLKWIWLDNEMKFSEKALMKWLKKNDIDYESAVLYASQQNDVTEWTNDLIDIKTRAMIIDEYLHQDLWLKIVSTAVYILNQTSSQTITNNKVSLQLWRESLFEKLFIVNISHLQIYECRCYIYILKKWWLQDEKFASQAMNEKLIDYKSNHIYRIWVQDKEKDECVVRAWDVVFDEKLQVYKEVKTRANSQNVNLQHLQNKNLKNKTLREFFIMNHSSDLKTLIITINNSSNDSLINDEDVKINYIFHQDEPEFDINIYLINLFNNNKELNKVSINSVLCAETENSDNDENFSNDYIVSLSDDDDDITSLTMFNDEEMAHNSDNEEEMKETLVSH